MKKTVFLLMAVIFANHISSVAWWYQAEPHAAFPKLPEWQEPEIN
jgi:hypothetical protein